jgi:hypothetical protein
VISSCFVPGVEPPSADLLLLPRSSRHPGDAARLSSEDVERLYNTSVHSRGLRSVHEELDRTMVVPRDQDEVKIMYQSMKATRDAARRGEHIAGWRLDAGRGAILREFGPMHVYLLHKLQACVESLAGILFSDDLSRCQARRRGEKLVEGMRRWAGSHAERLHFRREQPGRILTIPWVVRFGRVHSSIQNTDALCRKVAVEGQVEAEPPKVSAVEAAGEAGEAGGAREVGGAGGATLERLEGVTTTMMKHIRIGTEILCPHGALLPGTEG